MDRRSRSSDADEAAQDYRDLVARDHKFKIFFAGLIFATLSFVGTHQIQTTITWLKISEVLSLFLLLSAGVILLVQIGPYRVKYDLIDGLKLKAFKLLYDEHKVVWYCFIIGMSLLLFNRSFLLFLN